MVVPMSSASTFPLTDLGPTTALGADELARLGEALDAHGVDAHELAIRRFVAAARNAGLRTSLLDLVADPAITEPVRLRAFGHAAVQYAARRARPCLTRPHAA